MPSPQSEINQPTEVKPTALLDSINKGALDEMMKDALPSLGNRVMNNAHSGHAMHSHDNLNSIHKVSPGNEQGVLDFPSPFLNKGNSDTCGLNVQQQEMRKQFEDRKDDAINGQLKKSN